MRMKRKFYVGTPSVLEEDSDYVKATIAEAVALAKEKLEDYGDLTDGLPIVQIVRIVRRQKPPVVVEHVS